MSSTAAEDELGTGEFIEELNEIRQIAEWRMMSYNRVKQSHAVVDRVDQSDVQQAHVEFQTAVAAYVSKLRPYLLAIPGLFEETNLLGDDAEETVTFADIIRRQGQTVEQETTSGTMFDPSATETVEVPDLIDPEALRNAVHMLIEQQQQIGFLPGARMGVDDSDPF